MKPPARGQPGLGILSRVRYVLIIADGRGVACASGPDDAEGGLFGVLGRAQTPAIDAMGRVGKVGMAETRAGGCGSFGRGVLSLLGVEEHRAAGVSDTLLAAVSAGVALNPGDAVVRIDLVRVSADDEDGLMVSTLDPAEVGTIEHAALFDDLADHWRGSGVLSDGLEIVRTATGGGLLIQRGNWPSALPGASPGFLGVELVEPAGVVGERWIEHLPDGGRAGDAERLCALVTESRRLLAEHPINSARAEQGLDAINLAWFSDAGAMPADCRLPAGSAGLAVFVDAADDRVRSVAYGLCRLIGVPFSSIGPHEGASGNPDAGSAVALDPVLASESSVVVVLTDRGIESIDSQLVSPILTRLAGEPTDRLDDADDALWRVLLAVSHDPAGPAGGLRLEAGGPVPFALAGGRVRSIVERRLSDAPSSDLIVDPGSDLIEYVLRSGLRGLC